MPPTMIVPSPSGSPWPETHPGLFEAIDPVDGFASTGRAPSEFGPGPAASSPVPPVPPEPAEAPGAPPVPVVADPPAVPPEPVFDELPPEPPVDGVDGSAWGGRPPEPEDEPPAPPPVPEISPPPPEDGEHAISRASPTRAMGDR
jgi:homeobox protein ESX1